MSYIGNQPVYQAFVTDQFSGNGSTTAFTMSVAPANTASVLVAVSGVLQDPSTYSVSGTTLTFSAAPPSGTGNISARYLGIPASGVTTTAYRTVTEFTATAGQTTFTPPSYTAGYINVYRNGTLLGSADYTATNGTTVVLASGAAAGDLVTVESFYVSSVIGAIPATAGAVTSAYLQTGAVTQSKLSGNVVGNGPVLIAYGNTNQSISNGTFTKININVASTDSNSAFNTSTNRFQPTVAGYYQVTGSFEAYAGGSSINSALIAFYKNGNQVIRNNAYAGVSAYQTEVYLNAGGIVYLNGSTDYLELWAYVSSGGGITLYASDVYQFFHAVLVRAA